MQGGERISAPESGIGGEDLESPEGIRGAASMKRRTLSIREVAAILGVGKNTAYRAAKAGQIPTIRIGGRILVPLAALNDLIRNAPEVLPPSDSHGDE